MAARNLLHLLSLWKISRFINVFEFFVFGKSSLLLGLLLFFYIEISLGILNLKVIVWFRLIWENLIFINRLELPFLIQVIVLDWFALIITALTRFFGQTLIFKDLLCCIFIIDNLLFKMFSSFLWRLQSFSSGLFHLCRGVFFKILNLCLALSLRVVL